MQHIIKNHQDINLKLKYMHSIKINIRTVKVFAISHFHAKSFFSSFPFLFSAPACAQALLYHFLIVHYECMKYVWFSTNLWIKPLTVFPCRKIINFLGAELLYDSPLVSVRMKEWKSERVKGCNYVENITHNSKTVGNISMKLCMIIYVVNTHLLTEMNFDLWGRSITSYA